MGLKSNGPLGRGMGVPRPENDLVVSTSCMPKVSDDVLKLSQPAVIVLFAPMLMHLLQYILFLSLSYVNYLYKQAQRD
jgi:hypothetical protein